MGGVKPLRHLPDQLDLLGQGAPGAEVGQRRPLHELEDEAGALAERAHLVDPHHVRVLDPCLHPGLEEHALGLPGVEAAEELDRHGPFQRLVPGAMDLAHPAAADEPPELQVVVEGGDDVHAISRSAAPMRVATSSSTGSAKLE